MLFAPEHRSPPKTVLLWKLGALGDVLMTTPLVRQVRKHLPNARIDYLVGRSCRAVLDGNPDLDRILEFDERILLDARFARLGQVLALLRGYDAIYVLDKHWIFGWLAKAAGIPQRFGFRRRSMEGWPHTVQVPYGALRHEIHCYLDLGEAAGIPMDYGRLGLELPAPEPFAVDEPYVVAINSGGSNPGEESQVRKMPAPLFADLVAALAARSSVVFLGSAREHAGYEPLVASHGAQNLCGKITLRQAWGVLARARAVYTTDTGLMHMAGAVNNAVTAVFGPTHPLRKCPPAARWVWVDGDRYDSRYEVFGRLPHRQYFDRMTVDRILGGGIGMQPTPFSAATGAERTSAAAREPHGGIPDAAAGHPPPPRD